jgi:hypothetical protein
VRLRVNSIVWRIAIVTPSFAVLPIFAAAAQRDHDNATAIIVRPPVYYAVRGGTTNDGS